jgi:2-polyprenyl-3-methyl-5-hydroxy-6-metoxy-1,4-benzoquinol methylase
MRLERVACPYCGGEDSEFWAEENGFTAVRCASCRFVYVNPRPPLDAITEASRIGFHEAPTGKLHLVGPLGFRRAKAKMFKQRLPELFPGSSLIGRKVRWLDIGCGFGELLAAVEELAAPESTIEGIEPSQPKVHIARRRGLHVRSAGLDEIDRVYSFVSLINVLSHLPYPAQFLSDLPRLLEPGGRLLLVTGNGADMSRQEYPDPLFLPDHLVFAGEEHIRGLLEDAGFDIVLINGYRYALPESPILILAKNVVRTLLGRPRMPLRNKGPYRSLFVHAQLRR